MQRLFSDVHEAEHATLCGDTDRLPVRRFFERQWEHALPAGASRLEALSAHATEVSIRLVLSNAYLFKVDAASMKESLEVRVPMLDENLVAFGLTLPHRLKVKGRRCKRVLRELAARRLPPEVALKPKKGFGVPVDTWVTHGFKQRLRETLLARSSPLPRCVRRECYAPWVEAFCDSRLYPGLSRLGLYYRMMMLLSVHLSLCPSHE
jgi:asparagine synthase (glutamine-hydrolysing)